MRTNVNFDRHKYVVLLIGASEYKNTSKYANIPNVKTNIEVLKSIFLDKRFIGVNDKNVIVSLNEDSTAIKHALTKACRMAKNSDYTLFVYYSGHGIINPDNYKLYFATSSMDANYLGDDAIEAKDMLDKISRSAASRKIFVVDACHSGGIHNTMGDTTESTLMKNYEGVHFVSACDEDSTALFPKNMPNEPTYFTGALVNRVVKGMDVCKPFLSLREIVDDITMEFMDKNLPKPQQSSMLNADKMPFVKNVNANNFSKISIASSDNGKIVDSTNNVSNSTNYVDYKPLKNDNEMWKMVSVSNTVDSYNSYVIAFPYGVHINEAKEKINMLLSKKSVARKLFYAAAITVAALAVCVLPSSNNYNNDIAAVADTINTSKDTVNIVVKADKQYICNSDDNVAENLVASNDEMYYVTADQMLTDIANNNPTEENIAKRDSHKNTMDSLRNYYIEGAMISAEACADILMRNEAIEYIDKVLNITNVDDNQLLYNDMEEFRSLVKDGDQIIINNWINSHPQYRK